MCTVPDWYLRLFICASLFQTFLTLSTANDRKRLFIRKPSIRGEIACSRTVVKMPSREELNI